MKGRAGGRQGAWMARVSKFWRYLELKGVPAGRLRGDGTKGRGHEIRPTVALVALDALDLAVVGGGVAISGNDCLVGAKA
jgi:hypothetical protein